MARNLVQTAPIRAKSREARTDRAPVRPERVGRRASRARFGQLRPAPGRKRPAPFRVGLLTKQLSTPDAASTSVVRMLLVWGGRALCLGFLGGSAARAR